MKQVKCLNKNNENDECFINMDIAKNNASEMINSSHYYCINVDNKNVLEIVLNKEINTSDKKHFALKIIKRIFPTIFNSFNEFPEHIEMESNIILLKYFENFISLINDNNNDEKYTKFAFFYLIGLSYFIENNVRNFPIKVQIISEKRKIQFCSNCFNTTINKKEIKLQKCGGCVPRDGAKGDKNNKIFYCSTECQKAHWKEHKKVCEKHSATIPLERR